MKEYIKWLWQSYRCQHEAGPWRFRELGMGKVVSCKKCGKVLGLI